jgi:hypothetical protein
MTGHAQNLTRGEINRHAASRSHDNLTQLINNNGTGNKRHDGGLVIWQIDGLVY